MLKLSADGMSKSTEQRRVAWSAAWWRKSCSYRNQKLPWLGVVRQLRWLVGEFAGAASLPLAFGGFLHWNKPRSICNLEDGFLG